MKTKQMMTKAALCIYVPGLFTMPEDLQKKLKHGSKEELKQRQDVVNWQKLNEEKVIQAAGWLQRDGHIVCETITNDQYNRLSNRAKEPYVKISTVLGGLWSSICNVNSTNSETVHIAGVALKKDSKKETYAARSNAANVIEDYRQSYDAWNTRRIWYKMVTDGRLSQRKFNALMIERGFYDVIKGKKVPNVAKLKKWLGKAPVMPEIEAPPTHEVKNIKITLIKVSVKNVKTTKKVQKNGRTVKKVLIKTVETESVVKEFVVPLPDEVTRREVPGVVDAVVARLPRGGGLPDWTRYDWHYTKEKVAK